MKTRGVVIVSAPVVGGQERGRTINGEIETELLSTSTRFESITNKRMPTGSPGLWQSASNNNATTSLVFIDKSASATVNQSLIMTYKVHAIKSNLRV